MWSVSPITLLMILNPSHPCRTCRTHAHFRPHYWDDPVKAGTSHSGIWNESVLHDALCKYTSTLCSVVAVSISTPNYKAGSLSSMMKHAWRLPLGGKLGSLWRMLFKWDQNAIHDYWHLGPIWCFRASICRIILATPQAHLYPILNARSVNSHSVVSICGTLCRRKLTRVVIHLRKHSGISI